MPIGIVETTDVRFVQNASHGQLTIPDLGKKGCYLDVDEKVDLTLFFTKEEIRQSRDLARGLKNGVLIKLQCLSDPDAVKTVSKTEGLPMTPETPAVDGKNVFDDKYKELKEKDKAEELETRASER